MAIEKESIHFGPYKEIFAQGVRVGNLLHLAGQVGADSSGKAEEDIARQVSQAYDNIEDVLARFDASLDNVIDETWFVVDIPEIMHRADEIFAARSQRYGGAPAVAQTLVQVSGLVSPAFRVEIKVVAHL